VDEHVHELKEKEAMFTKIEVPTPAGPLVAAARGAKLIGLAFSDHWPREQALLERRFGELAFGPSFPEKLAAGINDYLDGDVTAIDELDVDLDGTPFQMSIWKALRTIPAGETISYKELARRAGEPDAIRAAGNANGKNPVSVVIPCHRVIHADGSIGGYGGGLPRKRWLLGHELKYASGRFRLRFA
jgi:methylated-DNA-[protein]-cysteine S-methyltransferase